MGPWNILSYIGNPKHTHNTKKLIIWTFCSLKTQLRKQRVRYGGWKGLRAGKDGERGERGVAASYGGKHKPATGPGTRSPRRSQGEGAVCLRADPYAEFRGSCLSPSDKCDNRSVCEPVNGAEPRQEPSSGRPDDARPPSFRWQRRPRP